MTRARIRRSVVIVGGLVVVGLLFGVVTWRHGVVTQPIAFNHNLHVVKLSLQCSFCHQGVETAAFATLPSADICLGCHVAPLSENPEEAKVRNFGGEKGEIPWKRLTRLPDHVYFSHQRHVKFGQVDCERCHGKMAERTKPPSSAPQVLKMNDCLECHQKQKASVDCVSCHR